MDRDGIVPQVPQAALPQQDLFKKESFVKGKNSNSNNNNNNNAPRIICSPTQKQGAGDGFSLCAQEIHKSPVLMRI